jgi:flavin prenyltransferase
MPYPFSQPAVLAPQPAQVFPYAIGRPARFVVGISGASGAWYAQRLLEVLLRSGHEVHLVVSEYGRRLLFDESDVKELSLETLVPNLPAAPLHAWEPTLEAMRAKLYLHPHKDVGAVIASGSFLHEGMVVLPCSSASLGAMASGAGSNLLTRAAMVTLKERRPLIVCHREMPLSLIDIRAMETLALAGATLCSPNPGFYLRPQTVGEVIDFTVGKVLDLLHVPHELKTRWEHAE